MSLFDEGLPEPPPYAISVGKALSLRAKTVEAARARIDGLVATAQDIAITEQELDVTESVDGRTFGHTSRNSWTGHGTHVDCATVVERAGHTLGPVASSAWQRFGKPAQHTTAFDWVRWQWRDAPDAYAFLCAHPRQGVRAMLRWRFRLRTHAGQVVDKPLPRSSITAYFEDDRSTAYISLVLPHVAATPEFFADCEAIKNAMGMRIAPNRFEVSSPGNAHSRRFAKIK